MYSLKLKIASNLTHEFQQENFNKIPIKFKKQRKRKKSKDLFLTKDQKQNKIIN